MWPISMAANLGWMSMSVSQPVTVPVLTGRTAQAIGSCVLAKSATKAARLSRVGKGP